MINRRRLLLTTMGATAIPLSRPFAATGDRELLDLAGRRVAIPSRINRVATVGAGPVMDGLVFIARRGHALVNGLPTSMRTPRWRYHLLFAPHMADLPDTESLGHPPSIETLIGAAPDVTLASTVQLAETLQDHGLPTLAMPMVTPDDIKAAVRLAGDLFEQPDLGDAYSRYFDSVAMDTRARLVGIAPASCPRVLYFSFRTLTQPHKIGEWWISAAGGRSVTDNGRTVQAYTFDIEQVLSWDPDILLVASRSEVDMILGDDRLSNLKATRSKRIFVVPVCIHDWGHYTVEQPLTVLWAATHFHPDRFPPAALSELVQDFYRRFFGMDFTDDQIGDILAGGV